LLVELSNPDISGLEINETQVSEAYNLKVTIGKLKLVSEIIPPQGEDIADIRDIPEAAPSGIKEGLI